MRSRFKATNTNRLRAPEDGIVTSTRPTGWVAERWHQMLDELSETHGARLSQGRNLARNGRVRGLWLSPGLASAQVYASDIQNVSLRFRVFSDAEWGRVLQTLLKNLLHIGALLEGQLPMALVDELEADGLDVLPAVDEVQGDCDCDDYMMPCAHMAAVHHVLAEALDGEPFMLFTLRGRPRAQLLAEMRKAWGDSDIRQPPSTEEPPPDGDWFSSLAPLPSPDFRFKAADKTGIGLRALGPPPGDVDLHRTLDPLYVAGADAALELALSDFSMTERDGAKVMAFKSKVQRPAGREGGSANAALTEAIVDALADCECAKSKEIASKLGVSITDVRGELLELEKLGIVYRTGQTRGTRWWLG